MAEDESIDSFRARARAWLESLPELAQAGDDDGAGATGRSADEVDEATLERGRSFQRMLHDAGFVGISWPREYGGQGLNADYETVWRDEVSRYELPTHMFNVGVGMCGPTVLTHGTEEQKRRFLEPLLRGEEIWAQLFSEPDAGSDLAAVSTRANRQDDGTWLLNGQKVWTSGGRIADFGLALVRTDPSVPKHAGLTMFILDMRAPGVTVRELRQMTGRSKFDEVFLDDVVVPDEMRVGEVGEGWRCARTTLTSERGAVGRNTALRGGSFAMLHQAAVAAGRQGDPQLRQELAALYTLERISGWFTARSREARDSNRSDPIGLLAKIGATRLNRRASRLAVHIVGPGSVAWDSADEEADQWALRLCAIPGLSIGGGTDEVIRNSIGELTLGLPREPRVDRDLPYDQLPRSGRS